MEHIIPDDGQVHIASIGCSCNPYVVVSEGMEQYIHKPIEQDLKEKIIDMDNIRV